MSSQSIENFKEYLKTQNDTFLQDGRRIEGIIRDIFPEDKSLIFLLTSTWKSGVVTELRQTANLEVTIAQFGDRLCRECGFSKSSALSAVRVWAYALGVIDVVPNKNVSSIPSSSGKLSTTPDTDTKKCPSCAEEVKKDAKKCKHCQSNISVVYYNNGNNYCRLGQHQRAIEDLNEAIRMEPAFFDAYFVRGQAYMALGQDQLAIKDYDETIRLNPNFVPADLLYNNRGFCYNNLGQYQRAIEDLSTAVLLKPEFANPYRLTQGE